VHQPGGRQGRRAALEHQQPAPPHGRDDHRARALPVRRRRACEPRGAGARARGGGCPASRPAAGRPSARALTRRRGGRYHKLRVLVGGFWRKENRPPSDHLFRPYADLPQEARDFLVKCAPRPRAPAPPARAPYGERPIPYTIPYTRRACSPEGGPERAAAAQVLPQRGAPAARHRHVPARARDLRAPAQGAEREARARAQAGEALGLRLGHARAADERGHPHLQEGAPRRKPAPPPPASHPVARCGARAAACGVACPAGSAARMPCCLRASRSCLRGAARAAGAAARRCWRTT